MRQPKTVTVLTNTQPFKS